MKFRAPQNTETIMWTEHVKMKMRFYNLSEFRLKRILRRPERVEEGVALRTVAVMQSSGSAKRPSEVWLMYQKTKTSPAQIFFENLGGQESTSQNPKSEILREKIIIISAWRYPGKSPKGHPPIPEDIIRELNLRK